MIAFVMSACERVREARALSARSSAVSIRCASSLAACEEEEPADLGAEGREVLVGLLLREHLEQ